MKYILYLVFSFGGSSSADPGHHIILTGEYNHIQACKTAAQDLQTQMRRGAILATCTQKG